ncbi:hypothetical protein CON97_18560 [Bacillus pseudomycoides]|nr:hypothetical protein CON79_02880 [Bacillus pseudomycoides]PED70599.1 hypothetical protein CON97_18560 [Bacillus pseudomycoides]PEI86378.1 hypothetical protein CN686_27950 [Bacillus pseudomycoides]
MLSIKHSKWCFFFIKNQPRIQESAIRNDRMIGSINLLTTGYPPNLREQALYYEGLFFYDPFN